MPFRSRAQMRAAFAGALGPTMQAHATTWAKDTPTRTRLPAHVRAPVAGLHRALTTRMRRDA